MRKCGIVLPLAVAWLLGAEACRSHRDQVAELMEIHGLGERDFAAKPEAWSTAAVGTSFAKGDALRTGAASDAFVRLMQGGGLRLGASSLVRFRGGASAAKPRLTMEAGEAEIEATGDALEFDTRLGEARIEAGGRVRVSAANDRVRFEVIVGRTILEGDGAAAVSLSAGETIAIDIGGAIIEPQGRLDGGAPSAAVSSPPEDPESPVSVDAGAASAAIEATISGAGAQMQARAGQAWTPVAPGDSELAGGTRVRLPKGTTLSVRRRGERASVRGSAEVVVGNDGGALLSAVDGQVTLDAVGDNVRIDVPGGSIVARANGPAGSRANVSVRRGARTDVTVERGEVEVRGKNDRTVLSSGQSLALGRGGDLPLADVAPSRVDFSIPAGESPVVHDPRAPTAIRIVFESQCPGQGEIELFAPGKGRKGSGRARGAGSAAVLAGPGVNRYRVRCVDEGGAAAAWGKGGVIRIARDSGVARLPREAPHDSIEADGRSYTVLYQNLLPELTVGWPRAPSAGSFTLRVQPERGAAKSVTTSVASVKFTSGQLAEGTYRFWFEVSGEQAGRSPETTLRIGFDNAAPAAEVQEPSLGAPIAGAVTVSGLATEGSHVSAGGAEVPLDGQFRFRGQASVRPGETALAIRIAHPKHGVHYYLRRGPP